MAEPSDVERRQWSETTSNYVEGLEGRVLELESVVKMGADLVDNLLPAVTWTGINAEWDARSARTRLYEMRRSIRKI